MRRTDDEKDQGPGLAGLSPLVSGPPSGQTVIPFQFPRRPSTAASGGLVAGGDPVPPPAPFNRLGGDVQAVVMRLKGNRVRIKVLAPAREEDEDRDQR